MIWVTSAEEASKLNVTLASGLAWVNASPMSVKASVSEAAAKTVMSPWTAGSFVVGAAVVAAVRGRGGGHRFGRGGGGVGRAAALVAAARGGGEPEQGERHQQHPGR